MRMSRQGLMLQARPLVSVTARICATARGRAARRHVSKPTPAAAARRCAAAACTAAQGEWGASAHQEVGQGLGQQLLLVGAVGGPPHAAQARHRLLDWWAHAQHLDGGQRGVVECGRVRRALSDERGVAATMLPLPARS